MFKSLIADAAKLRRDEHGAVTILFGLCIIVVCMVAALALDVGRAIATKSKVAAAADAGALAAAKAIRLEGLSDDQAIAIAKRVAEENMRLAAGKWTTIESIDVTIDRSRNAAVVDIKSSVPTILAGVAGFAAFNTPGTAAAMVEGRDVEVGVQLDLTGSMCMPTCSKRNALRVATEDLVKILIPTGPTNQNVRVAFAPFSAGVNMGPLLRAVNGDRPSVNNCVYERLSSTNDNNDASPDGMDAFKIRSDLPAPPPGKGINNCPGTAIVPLTSDRDRLIGIAKTLDATGSTAGQLGALWAWNLISPKWATIWGTDSAPVAYGNDKTDKVVILMTDGVYNTISGVNWGDMSTEAGTASTASVDICTNMKAQGITVYTVGFDLPGINPPAARDRATETLKDCAGKTGHPNPEQFFYQADNEDELRKAFRNIANDIVRVRLTN
jgi:Flp pilus assembly protein TadG